MDASLGNHASFDVDFLECGRQNAPDCESTLPNTSGRCCAAYAAVRPSGQAEREASLAMLDRLKQVHGKSPRTLGADRGYDSGPYCLELETRGVEPHVAMIATPPAKPEHVRPPRQPAVAARQRMRERLEGDGYRISQRCRKKIEECFGWIKNIAGLARSRHVGRWKIVQQLEIAAAAYNLVRMRNLLAR